MYWRILAAIFLLVGGSYFLGQRSRAPDENAAATAASTKAGDTADLASAESNGESTDENITFALSNANMPQLGAPVAIADNAVAPSEPEQTYSLDVFQESQRIASAGGVSLTAIAISDKLPPNSPMAMTYRRTGCLLLLNAGLPLEDQTIQRLSLYWQRQLTFTLAHEIGHCYMLTRVVQRDTAFLPSLSPPGKSYSFEQYMAMAAKYSEYPDLNRWNEEWADTFAAYALSKAYDREFATSVTAERYTLRKNQEKHGGVLMSNVYGGHGSLAEEGIFSIQSPLEIANLVKRGRLNTSR